MNSNPVLAELLRNGWVENRHRGSFCISDDKGNIIASIGDIERAIFPRSAIKSMQALALFSSGAVEKFDLNETDIAIAIASHHGEPEHIAAVSSLLKKIECTEKDLQCGAHTPTNRKARNQLFSSGAKPGAIHNNCSGKHAGMLAVAKTLGVSIKEYWLLDHPVQKLVKASIEQVLGEKLSNNYCGTDGCSIPTFAASLKSFATGFARMATGSGFEDITKGSIKTIFDAAGNHPFLIGGTDVFDSEVMQVFEGNLICKIGAEGVFCGAIRNLGLGFSLKCDDGNMLAAQVMIAAMLDKYASPNSAQRKYLKQQQSKTLKNWRGLEVAIIKSRTKSL
ncbi:MAG: asparaginase [Devosiaceae bacterium]|nr:asparaginase [Devosiaceae bacterium]